MADVFNLRERVIVVTGGCGLLGSAFAHALIERGARVAVIDLKHAVGGPNWLKDVADSDRFLYIDADVTKRTDLEAALKVIRSKWGTPFGLVNNAAIDTPPDAPADINCPFEDFPEAVFDAVMDVNVKGVVLCCQVFGRDMAAAGIGSIVNIASIYGMVSPDQSHLPIPTRRWRAILQASSVFNIEVRPLQSHALLSCLLGSAPDTREHSDLRRRI